MKHFKNTTYFIVIFTFLISCCCHKTVKVRYESGKLKQIIILKKNDKGQWVAHGKFVEFHENGVKCREGYFKHGKEQGEVKFWYPSGNLEAITHFEAGKHHGTETWWYENGNKKIMGEFLYDKQDGVYKYWAEDGSLQLQMTYVNGELHGPSCVWWPNGQRLEAEYKHGCLDSTSIQKWDSTGAQITINGKKIKSSSTK